jgi:DNA invertase Pin-like site-specific DNA recombinase
MLFSTENQTGEDAYGLETQKAAIAKYCQGLELAEIYEDPAFSGCLEPLAQPWMAAALDAMKEGGIERLVVYKFDRLARDLYFTLWIEKEVRKFGAEVISVTGTICGMTRPKNSS